MIIKEDRKNILAGLLAMLIIIPLIAGFTYSLLQNAHLFSNNYHFQFTILVTCLIIGIKDGLIMTFTLLSKLVFPYYIEFDKNEFYDCKLKKYIPWNKIDNLEFLNYHKSFSKKSNLFEYFSLIFLTTNTIGTTLEIIKYFILSKINDTQILVIKTQNKKELLQNAGILKKIESNLLPNDTIKINIDLSFINEENILQIIEKIAPSKISK